MEGTRRVREVVANRGEELFAVANVEFDWDCRRSERRWRSHGMDSFLPAQKQSYDVFIQRRTGRSLNLGQSCLFLKSLESLRQSGCRFRTKDKELTKVEKTAQIRTMGRKLHVTNNGSYPRLVILHVTVWSSSSPLPSPWFGLDRLDSLRNMKEDSNALAHVLILCYQLFVCLKQSHF